MKTTRFTLAFIAFLFIFSTLQAKSKVLLRLNLQKGSIYEMDMHVTSNIEQDMMGQNMKMTGTQTGTMAVDLNDGWVRSSDLNQKFDIHMKLKNPQTGEDMEIPMKVNSVTKYTVEKK